MQMKVSRDYILIILFPVLYILADIAFRYRYLIYYSNVQMIFYIISIFLSVFIFIAVLAIMAGNSNRKLVKHATGLLAAFYYSLTILSSYIFLTSTGIFPNYYTLRYFRNEPSSAFSLFKDSIHLWQVALFILFMSALHCYFLYLSESAVVKRIRSAVKPGVLLLCIFILLALLVVNLKKCDMCMIVDANFTAGVGRHLSLWNEHTSFTGEGLPSRKPLKLIKTAAKPEFNVLVIIFESLRTQNMQIYGYNRETTPFLCSFEKKYSGNFFVFRKTYTVSTTTMLAVPAILSGVTPEQPQSYFETFPLLWEYAGMLDYRTFFISSQSMQWYRFDKYYSGSRTGFLWNKDSSGEPPYNDSGVNDSTTNSIMNDYIVSVADKPFFGVMQYNATHFPYNVPDEYIKWNDGFIDKYDNSVLFQDDLLKSVFAGLEKKGLLNNTVVIMIGDHGEAFKEHNSIGHVDTYYSETVSVPLMIFIPDKLRPVLDFGRIRANTVLNTSNADIVPTIINLLGLRNNRQTAAIYPKLIGVNLFENFNGSRHILTLNSCEFLRYNAGVSLIKDNFHMILRTNIVPYRREFFDMKTDPGEFNNIIENAGPETIDLFYGVLKSNVITAETYNLFYPYNAEVR